MGPITDAHKLVYLQNVQLAVQQKKSRFEQAFTYHASLKGRLNCILELMGPAAAIIDGNRGGDTPNIDSNVEPIWVVPHQIEWGKLIEKEDAIKALTDYQSPFVQTGAAAIVRGRDSVLAASVFGNRLIGQDGAATSAWAGSTVANTVGSSDGATDTGFNVKKILRAKRYLQAAYVDIDMEDLWCVTNGQGMEELYGDITYINTQYREKAVLDADKQVRFVAGVNVVHYEGMTDIDGTHFGHALWAKSGMHYGDFDPLSTQVQPNPAKKYRLHPYMENWWGSSRSEDVKVVKISNKK